MVVVAIFRVAFWVVGLEVLEVGLAVLEVSFEVLEVNFEVVELVVVVAVLAVVLVDVAVVGIASSFVVRTVGLAVDEVEVATDAVAGGFVTVAFSVTSFKQTSKGEITLFNLICNNKEKCFTNRRNQDSTRRRVHTLASNCS